MRTIAFPILLMLVSILMLNISADACSCGRIPKVPGIPVCGSVGGTDPVFIGRAENVVAENGRLKVSFSVSKVLNGTASESIEVFTGVDTAICGYPFKQGEEYVVHARTDKDGRLRDSVCGRTVLLRDAADELAYYAELESGKSGTMIFGQVSEYIQPTTLDVLRGVVLAGIDVTIHRFNDKKQKFSTVTDANGAFLFREIPYDTYQIIVKPPPGLRELKRGTWPSHSLTIGPNRRCSPALFKFTRQGSIAGKVVDANGKLPPQQQLSLNSD